jgi:adenine-specific DNA-methyltransferase
VRAIATLKPMTVIFYEDGFEDDNVKINAEVILKDHGVEDVRSI